VATWLDWELLTVEDGGEPGEELVAARSGRCGGVGLMEEGTWGEQGRRRGRRPPWRVGGTAGCAGEQPSPSDTCASPGGGGGGGGGLVWVVVVVVLFRVVVDDKLATATWAVEHLAVNSSLPGFVCFVPS